MRKHYIALEEMEISDRVMQKIQAETQGEIREIRILRGKKQKRTRDYSL